MEITIGVLLACIIGSLPLLGLLTWWCNEIWYVLPLKFQLSGTATKLPPGHLGFPFVGEMLTFLWYFKILGRPDDFINSKRRRYGDGVGLYRTHLFGTPSIIACFPAVSKFIFQSNDIFILKWPSVDILGQKSLAVAQGEVHKRLRNHVTNAITRPDALSRIAVLVQPRMVAALQSWVDKRRINTYKEIKKVTFENIGKLFVGLQPGQQLDAIDELFKGLLRGIRAYPLNIPGTAYRHAMQCKKKLDAIFRGELEKKKKQHESEKTNDLMDGLMQIEDDEGSQYLSDQEALDNIVGLVVAGYESTSVASTWAIYYLAKYPNALAKLREENTALCKNNEGDFITREDVAKLKYTNKVVEETIRMANIAAFIFRMATREVEYKGYKIPKNWKVIVWARYFHTNPENFEDPMCFNPDRWNEPARPGTYQVFGNGSRICPGNKLARLQLALFLHHLSIGYKWELLNPDADMMYLSHPLPVDGVEIVFDKI